MLSLILLLLGVLYPAYLTFHAIEQRSSDKDRWLKYWVCYAVLSTFQKFTDVFLSWLPFYSIGKIILSYFLSKPTSATTVNWVYDSFISKLLHANKSTIDNTIQKCIDYCNMGTKCVTDKAKSQVHAFVSHHPVLNQFLSIMKINSKSVKNTDVNCDYSANNISDNIYIQEDFGTPIDGNRYH
ncbi:hypothetical protein RCL1_001761 [Eukaryota sp. TZLM3-RCL]